MRYIKIKNNELFDFSTFYPSLNLLIIELDNDGKVTKEIGIDKDNKIMHKFPERERVYRHGQYGIFDLAKFDIVNIEENSSLTEFNTYWYKTQ